jgi:hypothetical protein
MVVDGVGNKHAIGVIVCVLFKSFGRIGSVRDCVCLVLVIWSNRQCADVSI